MTDSRINQKETKFNDSYKLNFLNFSLGEYFGALGVCPISPDGDRPISPTAIGYINTPKFVAFVSNEISAVRNVLSVAKISIRNDLLGH